MSLGIIPWLSKCTWNLFWTCREVRSLSVGLLTPGQSKRLLTMVQRAQPRINKHMSDGIVCIHVYMYIRIYVHVTYVYNMYVYNMSVFIVCIFVNMYFWIYMGAWMCVHVCMCTYVWMWVCTCVYIYICLFMYAHICQCWHVHNLIDYRGTISGSNASYLLEFQVNKPSQHCLFHGGMGQIPRARESIYYTQER